MPESRTLLPRREGAAPIFLRPYVEALVTAQRPPAFFVPNLTSLEAPPVPTVSASFSSRRSEPRTKAAGRAKHSQASVAGLAKGGRGQAQPRGRSPSPQSRSRPAVVKKLLDFLDEVHEMYECRDNMERQVEGAMRDDPRHDRGGSSASTTRLVREQRAALDVVLHSLELLNEASAELVSSLLTPEEKRHLGLDSHVFQTEDARRRSYQYNQGCTPARSPTKKKVGPPTSTNGRPTKVTDQSTLSSVAMKDSHRKGATLGASVSPHHADPSTAAAPTQPSVPDVKQHAHEDDDLVQNTPERFARRGTTALNSTNGDAEGSTHNQTGFSSDPTHGPHSL